MPYRRLPNTDKARIRAMKNALEGYSTQKNGQNILSADTIYIVKLKLIEFTQAVENYIEALSAQTKNQKQHKDKFYNCKLYVSHFIQVINFAIIRNEFPKNIRKFYQLPINSNNVPALNSEKQIIAWGDKIIKGEQNRTLTGEKPITNPSLANLKIAYEKFLDSVYLQKNLQNRTNFAQSRLVKIRPSIDELIRNIWDEIEKSYENYPPLIRREKAKAFGIIYIYRKNEEKIELNDLLKI